MLLPLLQAVWVVPIRVQDVLWEVVEGLAATVIAQGQTIQKSTGCWLEGSWLPEKPGQCWPPAEPGCQMV